MSAEATRKAMNLLLGYPKECRTNSVVLNNAQSRPLVWDLQVTGWDMVAAKDFDQLNVVSRVHPSG